MKALFLFLLIMNSWAHATSLAESSASQAEKAVLLASKGNPDNGAEVYTLCRGCHRADAAGKPEAGYPMLAGQHASVIIKQMLDVRAGQRDSPKMHPFIRAEVVSEQDIADIAAYLCRLPVVQSSGKGDSRHLPLGKKLYERDCATCHGPAGEGDGARLLPRVAGQHFSYLYQQLRDSRDGVRRNANTEMQKVIGYYSDDELRAVSDFVSRLSATVR